MRICVFGGTGFIGSCLAAMLSEEEHDIVVPTRNREQCKGDLIVLPRLDLVQCDVLTPKAIDRAVDGCDAVVNLLGILNESSRHTFEAIHIEFNRKLAESLKRHGVRQVIYVSAIGAATGAPSKYLRSKGKAEGILKEIPATVKRTIIRPSVVFGRGDSFTSLFAKLIDLFPALMIPCPEAKFQPIWVEDLARIICLSLDNRDLFDKTCHAGGSDVLSLISIVRLIAQIKGRRPLLIPLGQNASYLMAKTAELIPFFDMLSSDNCDSMSQPNVCGDGNAGDMIARPLMSLETELRQRFGLRAAARANLSEIRHTARR